MCWSTTPKTLSGKYSDVRARKPEETTMDLSIDQIFQEAMDAREAAVVAKWLALGIGTEHSVDLVKQAIRRSMGIPPGLPKDLGRVMADQYPEIIFDDHHFLITEGDFDQLLTYQHSKPTGVYAGKCWKYKVYELKDQEGKWWYSLNPFYLRQKGTWWIGCYVAEDPPHPDGLLTPHRRALIVKDTD
jgi:hypothetical protein